MHVWSSHYTCSFLNSKSDRSGPLQVVTDTGVVTGVVTAAVTADLDRLGVKATGTVIDVELTTLPVEADAMHAGQIRHQKGVTAAETGVTVVEVVEAVMATGVAEGTTGVTTGVAEGEGEERLPSSLATGTVQTAAHITLQAVKPVTSAMRPSEARPSCV